MKRIAALSTPLGNGAIAVIRMSGDDTKNALKKIFSPFPTEPNKLCYGRLTIGQFCDTAMLVYFDAPKSYTGEESAELHLHGGVVLCRAVLEQLFQNGFQQAQNGEFTKRAFLNGKTNLSKAEGIIDMINAESTSALKAAAILSQNKLGKKAEELQGKLTSASARIEAALDYPEEDLEAEQMPLVLQELNEVLSQLSQLLDTVKEGKTAKYGLNIAIVGKTNVGKSSLFNALVGFDRAIVSDIDGTTRDTIEQSIEYKGIKFNFIDTAGQRDTADKIEEIGVLRAKTAEKTADIVLFVTDTTQQIQGYEKIEQPKILVCNKSDLKNNAFDKFECTDGTKKINVSALSGENIEKLKELIFETANAQNINYDGLLLTNQRHIACFEKAKESLLMAIQSAKNYTMDIVAAEIRQAWQFIGQVTGNTDAKTVVDEIFSKFCLGK